MKFIAGIIIGIVLGVLTLLTSLAAGIGGLILGHEIGNSTMPKSKDDRAYRPRDDVSE